MHVQPAYAQYEAMRRGRGALFWDGLCLPSGSQLTGEELERVLGWATCGTSYTRMVGKQPYHT